ncbi:MAG: hypothetical protein KF678_13385 [Phycisphaeraceae bacterium]|nr:hypothetical protein [Phycisphaeraceae bacterium]
MKGAIAGLAVLVAMLTACSPSGYSVQARNNMQQPVELRVQAAKKDSARTVESVQVGPGQNVTFHTKAERDEKVSLEARVVGDEASPPSVYRMLVGLSRVVIGPNPEAGKDGQPRVRVREDR